MWSVCLESSVACADCLHSPSPPGVSKTVTVDVKGSGPLWLKLRDLADGITYNFRIRAKTFIYGPEVEANITTGPGEGSGFMNIRLFLSLHFECFASTPNYSSSGAPGPPGEPFITRYGSALTIHWTSGDPGRAPITRYVIEARPSGARLSCVKTHSDDHRFSHDVNLALRLPPR